MTAVMEAPPVDADAILRAALRPKPKAKEKTPSVSIPGLRPIILKLDAAKIVAANAIANVKMLQHDAIAIAEPERVALSRKRGECLSSLDCDGLTYIHQCRYSAIRDPSDEDLREWARARDAADAAGVEFTDPQPPSLEEREAELSRLCAQYRADFETYFVEQWTLSVDFKKLTQEQKIQLAAMSPEGHRSRKVSKAFHQDRTLKPEIMELAERAHLAPVSYFRA